jgi:hypothetical protein
MRNLTGRLGAFGAVVALGLCASTVAGIAQQATPTDLVDALNGLFGKHAGDRAAHAKGICLSGQRGRRTDPRQISLDPGGRRARAHS